MRITDYVKATLGPLEFYFQVKGTENTLVCRNCRMCRNDPNDRKREICVLTDQILSFADIALDGRCPLTFEIEEESR